MKNRLIIRVATTMALLAIFLCGHSQSVLRSGTWFKFSVEKRGIYKIDASVLNQAGLNVSSVDPKKIRVYGQGGGMLAQANATARPPDLVENAIFISGENDGKFDASDFILFYAEGPDEVRYDVSRETFFYEHNLYADKNFYFLTISDENGKRITEKENIPGSFPAVTTYNEFAYHEHDEHNELTSGREWFGEQFSTTTERTFSFDAPGILANSTVTWVTDVMAQTPAGDQNTSFDLFFNGENLATQEIPPIEAYIYTPRGIQFHDTLLFNAGAAATKSLQEVKYVFHKSSNRSTGYLNYFLISFSRKLSLYGDQTTFRSASSLAQPVSNFQLGQVSGSISIWNITTPNEPAVQSFSTTGNTASFSVSTTGLEEYIIFNEKIPAPTFVAKVDNQNLRGIATPNLLIVTHPLFREEAERLASHRRSHSNISVSIVDINLIYNEFSSGRQDVTAIRDFVRHLYLKDPATLKSVLMMGRGSYDYKDRISNNTNFVPSYESRNSLHPLATYSSDDFFGFMETSEGEWGEEPAVNHSLDVAIGRLPVKSAEEAKHVIDKVIDYDTNKKRFGKWRKEITFVADDGNTDDGFTTTHQNQANSMADLIELDHPEFDTRKIFVGVYPKEIRPSGETSPSVNDAITKAFDRGTLIINFTGHGSERVWTDERVFTNFTIPELTNEVYPFMITATCEFGRQDDPAQISSAELCLLQPKSGAIGLVSTTRPVNANTNFALNKAFYAALFEKGDGQYASIGDIFRRTKNNSEDGVANRNFSLLGDPSLHLAMPQKQVVVTAVETGNDEGIIKALSRVTIRGEIQDDGGTLINEYNGILEATLFDKRTPFKTIGKNLYEFEQWYNALFRGKASIKDGAFAIQFIVPKNIAYELGQGKLSLYASNKQNEVDAAGAELSFDIGGSEVNAGSDNTAPVIELFMGDTTFVNGGITGSNTRIVAKLHDASGINISSYGIGNDMMAILDDSKTFAVSEYYVSDTDDFTSGYLSYPIKGLSPGRHVIRLKAWDTYNNPGEAVVEFVVSDQQHIVVEAFGNYPNPVVTGTTFYFTHSRSGEDLQGIIYIFNATGMVQETMPFTVTASAYRVELPELDVADGIGKKLPPGLYLARLVIRSLSDNSKSERVTKLIILN